MPDAPHWAVERARAALNLGMKVPEVEQLLVKGGLEQEVASAIVMSVIEGKVRDNLQTMGHEERGQWKHYVFSALFACVCLGCSYRIAGSLGVGMALIWVLPALAGIWLAPLFAERGSVFRAAGWVLLLLITAHRVMFGLLI